MDTNRLLYQANYRPAELAREKAQADLAELAQQVSRRAGDDAARSRFVGWRKWGALLIKRLARGMRHPNSGAVRHSPTPLKTP